MDAEYIGSMDSDEIRLEAVADSDYETKTGNSYLSEITESFEPLEVSSICYPCTSRVLTYVLQRDDTGHAIDQCNKWIITPYQICLRVVCNCVVSLYYKHFNYVGFLEMCHYLIF